MRNKFEEFFQNIIKDIIPVITWKLKKDLERPSYLDKFIGENNVIVPIKDDMEEKGYI